MARNSIKNNSNNCSPLADSWRFFFWRHVRRTRTQPPSAEVGCCDSFRMQVRPPLLQPPAGAYLISARRPKTLARLMTEENVRGTASLQIPQTLMQLSKWLCQLNSRLVEQRPMKNGPTHQLRSIGQKCASRQGIDLLRPSLLMAC